MKYIHELPAIRAGLDHLVKKDPVFRKLDIDLDNFLWPYIRPGLGALVRVVIGQQVSVKAAASLWQRFEGHVGKTIPAEKILALSPEEHRALGLSRQKSAYINGLAQAVLEKTLDLRALEKLDDEAVTAAI